MSAPLRRAPSGRILLTTDAVGGVWTYCLDLAEGLAGAGIETMLVVLGPSPSADQTAAALAVPRLSLIASGLPLDWIAREPAAILEVSAAIRGLARGRADLIHLNSPAVAMGGDFPVPVVGACHSCLATWWSAVREGPMPADFHWRSQALRQGMLGCDALVAPTRSFAQDTSRAYEILQPHVVWNGREPVSAAPASDRLPMVLTSGRLWDDGKNIAVLDAAAALIGAPLYAAGPLAGPNGANVQLGRARPLGRLSAGEMAAWLRRAPVYASSALYEPFGLGVLEAAQSGCALVLSDIGSLRELWDGAAVFVDPKDPKGYADAFDRLLRAPAERRRLVARSKARSARYGVAQMTAGILDIYARLQPRLKGSLGQDAAA